jgi:hypothetical protein
VHLVLIESGEILADPANDGYDSELVRGVLERMEQGGNSYEVLDASGLTAEQLQSLYGEVAVLASRKRVYASRVFGSRKQSGVSGFGTAVPALLLYERKDGRLVDFYPHSSKGGPLETIKDFLARALSG